MVRWRAGLAAQQLAGERFCARGRAAGGYRRDDQPRIAQRVRLLNLAAWHRLFFEEPGRPGRTLGPRHATGGGVSPAAPRRPRHHRAPARRHPHLPQGVRVAGARRLRGGAGGGRRPGRAVVDGVRIVDIGASPTGAWRACACSRARALDAVLRCAGAGAFSRPRAAAAGRGAGARGMPAVYDAHEDVPRQILTKQWIPRRCAAPVAGASSATRTRGWRAGRRGAATPHIAPLSRRWRGAASMSATTRSSRAGAAGRAGAARAAVCYVGGIMRTRGAASRWCARCAAPGVRLLLAGRFEDAALEADCAPSPAGRRWSTSARSAASRCAR